MADVRFQCPECECELLVDDSTYFDLVECPECKATFEVPAPSPSWGKVLDEATLDGKFTPPSDPVDSQPYLSRNTLRGVSLVYCGAQTILILFLLAVGFGLLMSMHPRMAMSPPLSWIMDSRMGFPLALVFGGVIGSLALLAGIAGKALCLDVPDALRAKKWIIAAIAFDCLPLSALLPFVDEKMTTFFAVIPLLASVCCYLTFLLKLCAVAGNAQLANSIRKQQSVGYLLMALMFLSGVFGLMAGRGVPSLAVLVVQLAVYVWLFIWVERYVSLLRVVRINIGAIPAEPGIGAVPQTIAAKPISRKTRIMAPAGLVLCLAIGSVIVLRHVQEKKAVVRMSAAVAADNGLPTAGMVLVPAGTFMMGSGLVGDDAFLASGVAPEHSVTLSSFYLNKYETTYQVWYDVKTWADTNGYTFANAGREGPDGTDGALPTGASSEPVTMVSWRDAVVWCNAYSEQSGLTPVYTYSSATIKDATDATTCDKAVITPFASGYRLPTEAQWEYAARYQDGVTFTPGDYLSGASANCTNSAASQLVAWYSANSGSSTKPVGGKSPNQLSVYDMSGNVEEWCWDWRANYGSGAQTDPTGPASGSSRVVRGGNWYFNASSCMVASRTAYAPNSANITIGFRAVLPPSP